MATGENGPNGVLAVKHVNMENKQEKENVTRQVRVMEERNALVKQVERRFATKTFLAQVIATTCHITPFTICDNFKRDYFLSRFCLLFFPTR